MAVHLITGDDESLLLTAVSEVVHRLIGDGDRSLMVDEFDDEEYEVRSVVDAAQTPPFLTESRVVVARGVGRFGADDVAPLVAYLADPLPSTELVLVAGGGRLAKALTDAVKNGWRSRHRHRAADARPASAAGGSRSRSLPLVCASTSRPSACWRRGSEKTPAGCRASSKRSSSAYGDSRILKVVDVEPFLGEAGGVPPWDLTDAVDRGDTTKSLLLLHRMMRAGERHPLQVMAILHNHYTKLLTLDGANANDEASVARVLGIKPGYPAKKALDQYRKLGNAGVVRAIGLLAQADLDLRGAKEWPDELVMEVLVARLSRLGSTARR